MLENNKVSLLRSVIIGIIIGLIIFSIPGLCQELYQYEVNVEIHPDMSAHTQVKFIFSNSTFDNFSFTIENSPKNIAITSPVECVKSEKSWGVTVYCGLKALKSSNFNILVDYDSSDLVSSRDDYFVFKNSYKAPVQTKNLVVLVKVPEGMGLIKSSIAQPYSPSTASVGTDGRRPILAWEKADIAAGDGIEVSVSFENIALIADYSKYIGMQLGVIIIVIALAIGFYKFYWKKRTSVRIVMPVLKKDEKIVFEKLLEQKGSVNQKVLVKESNYSKAKVSKMLKSLQERGLIQLERIGRTNKVHLVKDFKKKEQKTSGNN